MITIGKGLGPEFDEPPRQMIGIVGTVRETGSSAADAGVMYIPQSQVPDGITTLCASVIPLTWVVRRPVTRRRCAPRSNTSSGPWTADAGLARCAPWSR